MFISVGRYRSITMMMMMMMMSIQTNHAKKFSEKKRFRKAGSAFITGSSVKLLLQLVQEYFRKYT